MNWRILLVCCKLFQSLPPNQNKNVPLSWGGSPCLLTVFLKVNWISSTIEGITQNTLPCLQLYICVVCLNCLRAHNQTVLHFNFLFGICEYGLLLTNKYVWKHTEFALKICIYWLTKRYWYYQKTENCFVFWHKAWFL